MTLRGLTTEEAMTLVEPERQAIVLDCKSGTWEKEVLSLLRWQAAERVELIVRERVVPDGDQPWWGGSEGFVFGLDVKVDGERRQDLSDGQLLLKVLSCGGIADEREGPPRAGRCAFLCGQRTNLHLRLQAHRPDDRLLFAGAPVLGFTHGLGVATDGAEFVCYVMRNAGAPSARSVMQWRQLRAERILSARERIWLAHDLTRCVLTLEGLGLAHGDLSPENVLVLTSHVRTERLTLALVDFDLFYSCSRDCPTLSIHEPPPEGGAPGHCGYVPPEGLSLHSIVHGDHVGDGDVRYDRFALGILIFELLAWTDLAWDEPLIPQTVIDRLSGDDGFKALGPLAWVLGDSVRELLGRTLSHDPARWPAPQEWLAVLESPGIYQVCLSSMRSLSAGERQRCVCAYPVHAAFGDRVKSLPSDERDRMAEASAMKRTLGGWTFRNEEDSGWSERLRARTTSRSIPAATHFRWMSADGETASRLLRKRMHELSFCPVCGAALDIAGEVGR